MSRRLDDYMRLNNEGTTFILKVGEFSEMLCNELLRYIGTKELIYVRRRRSLYYENINNYIQSTRNPGFVIFETGSHGEGLYLPGSDEDYMVVITALTVLPPSRKWYNTSNAKLIMETKDVKPGFVRLRVVDSSSFVSSSVKEFKNKKYLSSEKVRDIHIQRIRSTIPDAVPHGPCATHVTASNMERDKVTCFASKVWPDEASEWKSRHRPNRWPSEKLIQNIVNDGCIFVPIGNPLSSHTDTEWRISFSMAEKKLVYSMNHTQLLCYGLLKLYLKHAIESEADLKNLLCSYFLKTCLFYCIEEEHIEWDEENFTDCFWICFNRLLHWVRDGYCPNYFIKANNMFESKIYGKQLAHLLRHLSHLRKQGEASFRKIPYLSLLSRYGDYRVTIQVIEPNLNMSEVEFLIDSDIVFREVFPEREKLKGLCQWLSLLDSQHFENPFDLTINKLLYNSYLTFFTQMIYLLCVQKPRLNKDRYKYLKLVQNIILHNCTDIDTCTGWLQYGTLCYITGQYSIVIKMLKHVLGKLKPYTVYSGIDYCKVNKTSYMANVCGRGLSILQKKRLAIAPAYRVSTNCRMYPLDIESEIKRYSRQEIVFIPAQIYINVLLFLSYKALGCTQRRRCALIDLYTSVRESSSYTFRLDLENILAIALKCCQLNIKADIAYL